MPARKTESGSGRKNIIDSAVPHSAEAARLTEREKEQLELGDEMERQQGKERARSAKKIDALEEKPRKRKGRQGC